jgi:hypothetical protein
MRVYFAISTKLVRMGSFNQCVKWAHSLIEEEKAKIVKIAKARPDEKEARIVCEVSKDGMRIIPSRRYVNLKLLKRQAEDDET